MHHFSVRTLARNIGRLILVGLLASCAPEAPEPLTVEACGAVRSRDAIYYASRMGYRFTSAHDLARWLVRPKVHIDQIFQRSDPGWRLLGQIMVATDFSGDEGFPTGEANLSVTGFMSSRCSERNDVYACPPGSGLYNSTRPSPVSSAAQAYNARLGTPRDSEIAMVWFPNADRRGDFRRNAQGFLTVDAGMQITEARCVINVDLPQVQIDALYRECLLRAFGLVEFAGPGGPRLLQARGAVRPDWFIAGWDVALACLTSLYSDTISSEEAF